MVKITIVIMLVHIVKITNVIRIPSVTHNAISSKVDETGKYDMTIHKQPHQTYS